MIREGLSQRRVLALSGCAGCLLGAAAALLATGRVLLPGLVLLALGAVAIAILGDMRRVLLALVLLDMPFQWDKHFGFREDLDQMAALSGWAVSVTTLALAGLYAMWIAHALVSPGTAWRPRLRAALFPSIFLGFLVASVAVAGDRVAASFQITMYAELLLLFVYIASTVRTRSDLRFVAIVLLVTLCVESVVTLGMFAGGFQLPGYATEATPTGGAGESRVTGTMYSPNNAGAYFAFMFAFAAAIYLSRVDAGLRRLGLVASVLALVPLGLTLSRGAWIACLVSVFVLVIGSRGRRVSAPAVAALLVAIVTIMIPLHDVVTARLATSDEGAATGRVPLIHMALEMVADHPLLGVGANNFALEVPGYAGGDFAAAWLSSVHHKYLLIWSEAGPGALVAFLCFVGAAFAGGWRVRRAADPLAGAVGLGLAAAIAGHAVHMNFDIFAAGTVVEMLWVAAAVVACPVLATALAGSRAAAGRVVPRRPPATPVPIGTSRRVAA